MTSRGQAARPWQGPMVVRRCNCAVAGDSDREVNRAIREDARTAEAGEPGRIPSRHERVRPAGQSRLGERLPSAGGASSAKMLAFATSAGRCPVADDRGSGSDLNRDNSRTPALNPLVALTQCSILKNTKRVHIWLRRGRSCVPLSVDILARRGLNVWQVR